MSPGRVGEWQLERYRLGELDDADRALVARALERDEALRARLAALAASDERILAEYRVDRMVQAIRARAAEPSAGPARTLRRVAVALAAGAAIVAAAVHLPRATPPLPETPGAETARIKGGGPHLLLYRKTPGGVEALRDGGVARPGDTVQIEYVAAGSRYGVVVSQDGRGALTVHHPAGELAAELAGGPVALPAAFELDDAPAFEAFYFVTSRRPFAVRVVIGALERATASRSKGDGKVLDLPADLAVATFLLRKDTTR